MSREQFESLMAEAEAEMAFGSDVAKEIATLAQAHGRSRPGIIFTLRRLADFLEASLHQPPAGGADAGRAEAGSPPGDAIEPIISQATGG